MVVWVYGDATTDLNVSENIRPRKLASQRTQLTPTPRALLLLLLLLCLLLLLLLLRIPPFNYFP